jgi:hypothetical protein
MNLRAPTWDDIDFIVECYQAWPKESAKGPVYAVDARKWVKNWKRATWENALIGETTEPVGLVTYIANPPTSEVFEIVIPSRLQGMGHSTAMLRLLQAKLVSEGVTECTYEALPGVIADLTTTGRFQRTGEGVGRHTGLPTVRGRATRDTVI